MSVARFQTITGRPEDPRVSLPPTFTLDERRNGDIVKTELIVSLDHGPRPRQ